MTSTPRVGFIGLGHQGAPMARSIARSGLDLVVYDIRPDAARAFADIGIDVATSARDVATQCDVVSICVVNDQQVDHLVMGDDGLLASMRPGSVLVVHSTITPQLAVTSARRARELGVGFVDAPVTGRSMQAREEGSLTVIAGGTVDDIERARVVLEAVGDRIVHVGGPGTAQVGKICNNLMLNCNGLAVFETMRLAAAYGISEQAIVEIGLNGSGGSWSLDQWPYLDDMLVNHPLARVGEDAIIDFFHKDVALAVAAADSRGVDLPMGSRAEEAVREVLRERRRHVLATSAVREQSTTEQG